MYTTVGTCCAFQLTVCWLAGWPLMQSPNQQLTPKFPVFNRQSTEKHNMYQLLHTYSIPPDNGLLICPKHVEVD